MRGELRHVLIITGPQMEIKWRVAKFQKVPYLLYVAAVRLAVYGTRAVLEC